MIDDSIINKIHNISPIKKIMINFLTYNIIMEIYTIGHSTKPIKEFIAILKKYKIELLVDVRSIPGSSYNPQYNMKSLEKSLLKKGINYVHMKSLGGFRKTEPDSINMAWRNKSFRGFADYMQTKEFRKGLLELIHLSKKYNTVIMCSEAVPWRCHRSLIADALIIRKIKVIDIYSMDVTKKHNLTSFAKVNGTHIYYP